MKILIYGAGVIGSVYAAFLHHGGHEVVVLGRGRRLAQIREHGVRLETTPGARAIEAKIATIEELEPHAHYDLVLVAMQRGHLDAVIPLLANHPGSPCIAFVGNTLSGPDSLQAVLGDDRVLMGFPDFGGYFDGDRVRFATRTGDEESVGLTLGEPDGRLTPRLGLIAEALAQANVRVEVEKQIDAWLKGHVAMVLPIFFGLARHDGDNQALAQDTVTMRLVARATRECLSALRSVGVPLTPFKLKTIIWLPVPMTTAILGKMLASDFAKVAFAGHAAVAAAEFELLLADFRKLVASSGSATPALDALCEAATSPVT